MRIQTKWYITKMSKSQAKSTTGNVLPILIINPTRSCQRHGIRRWIWLFVQEQLNINHTRETESILIKFLKYKKNNRGGRKQLGLGSLSSKYKFVRCFCWLLEAHFHEDLLTKIHTHVPMNLLIHWKVSFCLDDNTRHKETKGSNRK